jgi:hypothetical protein
VNGPCPFCGAETMRLAERGTVRAFDAFPSPSGTHVVDQDAGTAKPTEAGPSFAGNRHHLHKTTCTDWRGPVGG